MRFKMTRVITFKHIREEVKIVGFGVASSQESLTHSTSFDMKLSERNLYRTNRIRIEYGLVMRWLYFSQKEVRDWLNLFILVFNK